MPRRDRLGNELPPRMYHRGQTYYRVTAEGSRRIWTPIGQDFASALRRWASLEGGSLHAETLADVAAAYLRDETYLRLRDESRRSYGRAVGRVLRVFGHQRLEDIQPREIAEYQRLRTAKRAAAHELTMIGILYRYAREQGWWHSTEAPSDGIRRAPRKPRRRVASPEEISKLLLAAEPLWQRIIEFAVLTGARTGEIRLLRRDAITEGGVVIARPKTGTESLVRWSPALRAAVDGALGLQPDARPSLYVFAKRDGSPYRYGGWRHVWLRVCALAGVEGLHFHDLRRTAATAASDLEHARALLGHTSPAMTGRVYRVRDEVEPTG